MTVVCPLIESNSKGLFLNECKLNEVCSSSIVKPSGLQTLIEAFDNTSEIVPSKDGQYFIHLTSTKVLRIYDTSRKCYMFEREFPGLFTAQFSPQANYLHTFQTNGINTEKNFKNMKIFKIDPAGVSLVHEFSLSVRSHKLFWSDDERLVMYVDGDALYFFRDSKFSGAASRIGIPGLRGAFLSPSNQLIVTDIHNKESNQRFLRMVQHHNFSKTISSVAIPAVLNSMECKWNATGTASLVVVEVDSSERSYYDERKLYFISMNRQAINLDLKPKGLEGYYAIHDIAWSPDSRHFVVIHGALPAETFVFNTKCEVVFRFPTAIRNVLYFNPFGNVLCATAHGNAHGDVEMWNMDTFQLISRFPVKTKTKCLWLADGKHMIFAVTSPTLRVDNGYEIWNFMAEKIAHISYTEPDELFDVFPIKSDSFKATQKPIIPTLAAPVDLTPKVSQKLYKPKPTKQYISEDLESLDRRRKNFLKSQHGKNVNRLQVDIQNSPFIKNGIDRTNSSASTFATTSVVGKIDPALSEYQNQLKALNKKIKGISKLKGKIATGYTPNSDQLAKLDMESYLVEDKNRLERLIAAATNRS